MNEMKITGLGEIKPELDSFEQASAGVDGIDRNYASEPEEDRIDRMARLKLRELDYFDVDRRKLTRKCLSNADVEECKKLSECVCG
ncbi:hypothetical protein PanWU01x14_236890 [Parasponia andersonii]|uniref:Uncharacterized protein n=1 Tax=Parasponia andersonii TaxID=3476 RepID=A0A2P5BI70_PARAD|nr:hypothetical protein PanWU01x14_236890 [Parasponia andersonii]